MNLTKMVKKKIHKPSSQYLHKKSLNGNKPNKIQNENESEDHQEMDHSIVHESINLGSKNVRQILTCISNGSTEVKDLILNECNIIYECRVCLNLFRSLANFVAHKRIYCKEHYCEKMVLYDPAWLNTELKENENENNCCALSNKFDTFENFQKSFESKSNDLGNNESINEKIKSEEIEETKVLEIDLAKCDNSNSTNYCIGADSKNDIETFSSDVQNVISNKPAQLIPNGYNLTNKFKRMRIENIVTSLNKKHEDVTEDVNTNLNEVVSNDHDPKLSNSVFYMENFAELEANFNFDEWKDLRKNAQKTNKFLYKCPSCGTNSTYVSNAIRHLVNKHHLSRHKAKVIIFLNYNKTNSFNEHQIKEEHGKHNDDSGLSVDVDLDNESKVVSPIQSFEANEHAEEKFEANCTEARLPESQPSLSNSQAEICEPNSSQEFPQKRYATRHLRRKKCFFDCNDLSCSKHNKHLNASNHSKDNHTNHDNVLSDYRTKSHNLDNQDEVRSKEKIISIRTLTNDSSTEDNVEEIKTETDVQMNETNPKSELALEKVDQNGINEESASADNTSEDVELLYSSGVNCSFKFDVEQEIAEEMNQIADYGNGSCLRCNLGNFETVICLQHHIVVKHIRYQVFCCSICDFYSTVNWHHIEQHLGERHDIPKEECKENVNVNIKHPPLVLYKKYLPPEEVQDHEIQEKTDQQSSFDDSSSSCSGSSCSTCSTDSSDSSDGSKLITKLSIKNRDEVSCVKNKSNGSKKRFKNKKKDSKLKLHLRTIGSKKYQIVESN